MSKFLRALLITAAATGVVAVLLNALDLDGAPDADAGAAPFDGMDPDDLSEEDVDTLMNELASQLNL
jgi:hypothetical protein